MPLVRRLPKRGFRSRSHTDFLVVNVGDLARFGEGATVDAAALRARGLIRGRGGPVKLLADGDAPKRLDGARGSRQRRGEGQDRGGGRNRGDRLLIGGVQNIGRIPELQRRILFTFGMLAVYRVGSHIVTPGINPEVVKATFARMAGSIFALFNVFSGGALEQLSIFALGIMPYISASIIIQLLTIVVPQLDALRKEGEQGQRKITQYTRYGTIVLAMFQGFLIANALEGGQFGEGAVLNPGWSFRLMCMITLTSGTAFIMWLGEQITERGIGNGISLIIFSGIVIGLPRRHRPALARWCARTSSRCSRPWCCWPSWCWSPAASCSSSAASAASRSSTRGGWSGKRMTQGGTSYFPLRVNTANVIPPIFASSILMFPVTIGQFSKSPAVNDFFQDYLYPGGWLYSTRVRRP